jgi:putative solute:sodium symporter small subunit
MAQRSSSDDYWRKNRLLIAALLAIWALVSYVFAIFLAEPLYDARVGQLPASFWWAQQGAIFVFVLLIFVYALVMDRLDRHYDVHDEGD